MKFKSLIWLISFICLITFCNSYSQAFSENLTFNTYGGIGYSSSWSEKEYANIPTEIREDATGRKLFLGGECYYSFENKFELGIGFGFEKRYGEYETRIRSTSDQYYIGIQKKSDNKRFGVLFQAGIIKGNFINEFIPNLTLGGILNLSNPNKRLSIGLRPSVNYNYGDSEEKIWYDCRRMAPNLPCTEVPYTVYYKTMSFNVGLVISFNKRTLE